MVRAGAEAEPFPSARFYVRQKIMGKSITVRQKKRGRPATGVEPQVTARMPQDMIRAIEKAAAAEDDKPSRSEMIRRIVGDWLRQHGYLPKGG